jgi:predicted neuraminidase
MDIDTRTELGVTDPPLGQPDAHVLRPRPGDAGRHEAFIPSPCLQNHAANLLVMPDGDVLCTWFGGTQEGIPDISVYLARLPAGSDAWLPPEKLSDDAGRSEQNPILFPAPGGGLWLFWTAQLSGNQDTALVRRRISHDGGRSWGVAETLFDVVGTSGVFVRQPPTVLDTGEILLPLWYCHGRPGERWVGSYDTSAVRISHDSGATWEEVEVPDSTRTPLVRPGGDGPAQQQLVDPIRQAGQWSPGAGVQRHQRGRQHGSARFAVRRS